MTEAIRKAVAEVLPKLKTKLQKSYGEVVLTTSDTRLVIAALEDMQGVADETYIIAPIEPTEERLEAGRKAWKAPRMHVSFSLADDFNTCGVIYRAMISKVRWETWVIISTMLKKLASKRGRSSELNARNARSADLRRTPASLRRVSGAKWMDTVTRERYTNEEETAACGCEVEAD
jgi:hypothetical protein